MLMTPELRKELYPHNTVNKREFYSRLEPIARTKRNVLFFNNINLPVASQQHSNEHYNDEWGYNRYDVCTLDSFQNFNDFYNELRGVVIKPLMCDYLSYKHGLNCSLEIMMLAINIFTLSPKRALKSLYNAVTEGLYALGYLINQNIAAVTCPAFFVLRCLITIAEGLYHLVNPAQQDAPLTEACTV